MADALVSFLVNELATVIKDEIQQEVRLVVGVEDEISELTKTFKAIQAVLKDADHKQFKDELVKLWLEEFKDVAYDMDDVLDEWRTEMLIKSQIMGIQNAPNNKGNKKVHCFLRSICSCLGEVSLRHDIGARIKNIRKRVDFIANEKDKYHLIETNIIDKGLERLETSSLVDESVVCGRNFEKEIIITKLLGESGGSSSSGQREMGRGYFSHPSVLSIVGMGGLGKTTLAQLVINNERVKNHFDKTMWVCVSDPFNLPRLAGAIIEEAGGIVPNNPEWNKLHNSLSESVTGMRFLLVLDDVWSEDPIKWECLELSLKSSERGSRVLVTTRNKKVAKIMNSTDIYDLEILSDNDCWSLISHLAFVGRDKQEQETLTDIGIEIAKKCKGLPLAAKALGSLLRFKSTKSDWENILKSELWEIEEVENDFLKPALLLSYFDLPSPLKLCFTYCSIFPKDYLMKKDVLIKLWMAQGYLDSTGKRGDLEMIGEEYFNNLVLRSFFQDIEFVNGNVSWCKMHDLLHDFAQFLTKNECYITQKSDRHYTSKIRHLTIIRELDVSSVFKGRNLQTLTIIDEHDESSVYKAKNLRTFQLLWLNISVHPSFFSKFSCLRVLCLKSSNLKSLPSEIGKLIHLRYLDLSHNKKLENLPESITTLYNLQTLELAYCKWLRKLPKEMWRLNNLRHLDIDHCLFLEYLPQGIGKLTSLRTLTKFPLSGVTTQGGKISELKDLNNLKGELEISGLGCIENENEASESELKNKNHLRVLELIFTGFEVGDMNSLIEDRMNGVLKGLQPHPKLETLIFWYYIGSKFPSWVGDKSILSHLKVLTLRECQNCIEFPFLGRLPSLEELWIDERINETKQIGLESYVPCTGICGGGGGVVMNGEKLFPKLKKLYLGHIDNLEELGNEVAEEGGVEIMPCLVKLGIRRCSKLKSLPRKLANLEEFDFHEFSPSLSQLPSLPKLKQLTISGGSSVTRLPQGLLSELKALIKLEIVHFPELICVPEEVKHLTNLQQLSINRCEMLGQRCRKGEGEDWSIISHIPNINIIDCIPRYQ